MCLWSGVLGPWEQAQAGGMPGGTGGTQEQTCGLIEALLRPCRGLSLPSSMRMGWTTLCWAATPASWAQGPTAWPQGFQPRNSSLHLPSHRPPLAMLSLRIVTAFSHILTSKSVSSADFPGGPVVKNPPASARDTGSIPGPGRSHMPWSN